MYSNTFGFLSFVSNLILEIKAVAEISDKRCKESVASAELDAWAKESKLCTGKDTSLVQVTSDSADYVNDLNKFYARTFVEILGVGERG